MVVTTTVRTLTRQNHLHFFCPGPLACGEPKINVTDPFNKAEFAPNYTLVNQVKSYLKECNISSNVSYFLGWLWGNGWLQLLHRPISSEWSDEARICHWIGLFDGSESNFAEANCCWRKGWLHWKRLVKINMIEKEIYLLRRATRDFRVELSTDYLTWNEVLSDTLPKKCDRCNLPLLVFKIEPTQARFKYIYY